MTIVRIQGPYDADMLVSKRTKLFSFLIGIIFVQFVHCVKGVDVAEDATDDDMTFATIVSILLNFKLFNSSSHVNHSK